MKKISIGNSFINPDDIVELEEKDIVVKIPKPVPNEIKSAGFFKRLFYDPGHTEEHYFCLIIGVDTHEITTGEFPVLKVHHYTIYSDRRLYEYAKSGTVSPDELGRQRNPMDYMNLNGTSVSYVDPDYINTNMEYDPDVKSKQDFIRKYLN